MSHLREIRDLLQTERAVAGRVVAVSGDRVQVATSSGVVEVTADANLKTGDAVTVQNGRAVKKRLDGDTTAFFV